jgi:hypothetical protein
VKLTTSSDVTEASIPLTSVVQAVDGLDGVGVFENVSVAI